MRGGRATGILLLLWIVGSAALGRFFTAREIGHFDAQLFAYAAERWNEGVVPYAELWENKPPGAFAWMAAVFRFFPLDFTALAVVEGFFLLGAAAATGAFVRRLGCGIPAAAFAALAVAIGSNLSIFNQGGGLTEMPLLFPSALGMWLFARAAPRFRPGPVFLAGVVCAAASLFKTVGVAPVLAAGAALVLAALRRGIAPGAALRAIAALAAGALAAWIPFLLYFAGHGALREMLDAVFLYNIHYGATSQPGAAILSHTLEALGPLVFLLAAAAAGLAVRFLPGGERCGKDPRRAEGRWDPADLVSLWLLADLAGAMFGGRSYPHYFLAVVPSASAAAAVGVAAIASRMKRFPRLAPIRALPAALVLLPLVLEQANDLVDARRLWIDGPKPTPWEEIAAEIDARSRPGDRLFTWGFHPEIFSRTGMRSPAAWIDAHYRNDSEKAMERYEKEIRPDLERGRPVFLVDGTPDPGGRAAADPRYAWFLEFLRGEYVIVGRVGPFRIAMRADAAAERGVPPLGTVPAEADRQEEEDEVGGAEGEEEPEGEEPGAVDAVHVVDS